jgi:hypothetical protein
MHAAGESRQVSEALLEFFTDLSVLVRTTPAPCPWCGSEDIDPDAHSDMMCDGQTQCFLCRSKGPGVITAVTAWNRVAVPMAYRRLR